MGTNTMKKFISSSVFGVICIATTMAFAGPPARGTSETAEGAQCPRACYANVAPHLTRAALYGTVVPRCHQKSSTAVRWGNPPADCQQNTQVASK